MALEKAKAYLEEKGYGDRVMVFDVSSATVELAAKAVGTEPEKIAKSMTFKVNEKPVMIVCAGDAKVNNQKFKETFHVKAKMLSFDEVHDLIGHDVGGVCPFGINEGVDVYLDESLKRFEFVYPACGSDNSAVKLSIPELEEVSDYLGWVDICKLPEQVAE
ncbi:MAG: YbaK/EbsC family protein [Lachnospiraceae bacterium]|nr:YbaK/EbsC family protein [Lachnospiraceae bacterium]